MQEFTGLTIDYGDDPPLAEQLTIDGLPIIDPLVKGDFTKFRIMTSIFPAIVPDADYGRSVKDFLDESLPPGQYAAIVEGYFVLLKDFPPGQTYLIHSRASAPRERGGPYVSELLYEISVEDRIKTTSTGAVPFRPPRNEAIIRRLLNEKVTSGELTQTRMQQIIKQVKL